MDEFERPKTRVQWMLGNNCNYNCSYCLDIFKRGDLPFVDNDLLIEVSKDIIYHYDELGRDVIFEFVGGEPTLVDKIPDIGNRLHNYPTNLILKTNGSASLEWWSKTRRYLSEVIISVHREFADINHIKEVIRLLNDDTNFHPVHVKVLFPVTNKSDSFNWGVKYVKEFQEKYGLGELQLLYSDFGRGSSMHLPYTSNQWDKYHELDGSPRNYEAPQVIEYPVFKGYECYAGIDILVIDPFGNVFRSWCMQGGKIGNIYEMPVSWPSDTIICSKEACGNGFDRLARKDQL